MNNPEVERINKKLGELYGKNLSGKHNFRVIWSDDQLEFRDGTFNDYYGSVFVRTFKGIRQVPKYSYIKERWILEILVPPVMHHGLVDHNGYEPLYVFESAKREYLVPKLEVCKIILHLVMNPEMNALQRKELFETMDKRSFSKDVEYFKDVLEDASPYMGGLLKAGEAAVVQGLKKEEECKEN
jgi:hypothetical protein